MVLKSEVINLINIKIAILITTVKNIQDILMQD